MFGENIYMNTKNHQIRIIIYIIIGAVIAAVGVFLVLHSNNSQSSISLQDKLDLGHKYLVELSYDKAVLEFTDAIEIDPMNADAYLGLADAYIGQGDTDKAVEVLEKGYDKTADEKIKEKLDELKPAETTQNIETTEETTEDKLVNEYVYMYIPNQVKSNSNDNYHNYERNYHGYSVWTNWDNLIYYRLTGKNHECYLFSFFVFPEKEDSIVKIDTSHCEIEIGKKYANSHITYNINENEKQEEWYDENGVHSETIIYGKDTDEVHIHIKYDSYGNMIEYVATGDGESAYTDKQTISYTYNEDGRIVKKVTKETSDYSGQTYYTFTLEYFYDSNGNKTKCIDCVYYTDDEVHQIDQDMVEFFYDDNNNLIKSVSYDKGNEESYTTYEYDKYDNLISETTSSADGDETRTEYSYLRVKVLRSEVEKLKEDYGVELKVFEIE